MRFVAVFLSVIALVSCTRDPNYAKKRYLEMGDTYFKREQFKQARILYRNALQKDQRFGPAYYKLALTEIKLGQPGPAVESLRRAVELLKPADNPDRVDAQIKMADIYLAVASDNKALMDEADTTAKDLLKKDPNSFDGHRLTAELTFVNARGAFRAGHPDTARKLLQDAIQEYRKANSIKPGQAAVVIALARTLAADQQYPEAEKLYQQLIAKDKSLAPAYLELYRLYAAQNRLADAETTLKTAISNNPKQYAYLRLLAAYYYATKRQADMVRVLEQIRSHAKDFPAAYLTTGDFYLTLGDGDSAIKQYKDGMAADPKRKAEYQKRMIEVLMRQGKRAMAAEINDAILKNNPKDVDARGLQAQLLLEKGEVQKAVSELQSVVSAAPDNFVAQYNLGKAHLARAEYEQARQRFAEAIRLRWDYVPARESLAQLQVSRGDYEAALKSAQEILGIDKGNRLARIVTVSALIGMKKHNEARTLLDAMLKADPNGADFMFQLAVLNLSEGKYKEAEATFRKTFEMEPSNARGLMGVVETYMTQDKPNEAIQVLQAEIQKNPNRMDYHLALGNTAARAGKYDMALAEYQKVTDNLDRGSRAAGEMYVRMGEVYRRKGDLGNAVRALEKARDALPENSIVISTLALVLDAAGRKQEARMAYERALKLDPRNGVALNNLAFLLAENNGDLDQALTYAQRAKQLLPQLDEVSDTLGWIYLKKNLTDNAIEAFKEIVTKQPLHSTYRYHLGMAYTQKGDRAKAIQELQTALKNSPPRDEADKIKALLQKLG